MIWYYLYMGLLLFALLVWVLAAMKSPPRPEQEPEGAVVRETLEFRKKE